MNMIRDVQDWAIEKGIYRKSTATTQATMMYIELGEFADAMLKDSPDVEKQTELGDVIVCLINYLTMMERADDLKQLNRTLNNYHTPNSNDSYSNSDLLVGFMYADDTTTFIRSFIPMYARAVNSTPVECLRLAYNKIINRTGKMINGKFVKSTDL